MFHQKLLRIESAAFLLICAGPLFLQMPVATATECLQDAAGRNEQSELRQDAAGRNEQSELRPATNEIAPGNIYPAQDTLSCGTDSVADAQQCLQGLVWKPEQFEVHCQEAVGGHGDWLIRFPSPLPLGNQQNDLVAMEWYASRNADKSLRNAPAVVVIHESGRGMNAGRFIARGLNAQGLHAFLLQMPGYGVRRTPAPPEVGAMLSALRQAVADARRARDAVVALPYIDTTVVGLQGTSLGGFVTATVAGMDHSYDRVFILLAGGNLHDVVMKGAKDAAGIREKLRAAGFDDQQIAELSRPIEPMRLAHRVPADRTWLYSGKYDDVVPPACSLAFVEAAKLPHGHHIELPADHYSGVVFLPMVLQQMRERMTSPLPGTESTSVPAPAN